MSRHTLFYILLTALLTVLPQGATAQAPSHKAWVENVSKPAEPAKGLKGHHVSIWPSHGRFYNFKTHKWEWQRPRIFCTTEDLFTQSIVIPYLIPMLENAGAYVYVPKERDWQRNEYVVDNDRMATGYMEFSRAERWDTAPRPGFAPQTTPYKDGDRPFAQGTARIVSTTLDADVSKAYYKPNIARGGRYAVYVSYQTVPGSVDDAEYTVVHQGKATKFHVNQQMGSGTWVYLGTFEFDAYSTFSNYVMVTNRSSRKGFVTTDAVKFGGGMGSHSREGKTSGLPRSMECARYWAQYAGAPRAAVCSKGGYDDYGDDINVRSLISNWISYGSSTNPDGKADTTAAQNDTITLAEAAAKAYLDSIRANGCDSMTLANADSVAKAIEDSVARVPLQKINVMNGKAMTGKVPIEMQVGIHSDAGWAKDFKSVVGTLTICTSNFNGNKLASGESRSKSYGLACDFLYDITREMKRHFGQWEAREVRDRNYSETRLPAQASNIIEMLSHENFTDMKYGHDPYFKFVMARAIYKTILKYIARNNARKAVVQPLPPKKLQVAMQRNIVTLTWEAQTDSIEKTADPTSYNIYTRIGDTGYDNGKNVVARKYSFALQANKIYRFRVTAVNDGVESFPTEELVALYNPEAKKTVLIVNAFNRLSAPAVVENDTLCGFDINEDIGLSYGKTTAWVGRQTVFEKTKAGKYNGLGYTATDLEGRYTAGNDFNYAYTHAEAISRCGAFNIISTSDDAFEDEQTPHDVALTDIIFGNEKDDGHSLMPYKTFTTGMRQKIEQYMARKCPLMLSGSYIASDMQEEDERTWLRDNIRIELAGCDRDSLALFPNEKADSLTAFGRLLPVYRHVNEEHYAAVAADIIEPADTLSPQRNAPLVAYASGKPAAALHKENGNAVFALGFPFECIKHRDDRLFVMRKITEMLLGKDIPTQ